MTRERLLCLNWVNRKPRYTFQFDSSINRYWKKVGGRMKGILLLQSKATITKIMFMRCILLVSVKNDFWSLIEIACIENETCKLLTLTSMSPLCSVLKPPMLANSSFISAVMWIFKATKYNKMDYKTVQHIINDRDQPSPVDSMRLAVFTVSPNKQYRGIFVPTIPATTGPVCAPHLICSVSVVLQIQKMNIYLISGLFSSKL